jgi:hypothetical protein
VYEPFADATASNGTSYAPGSRLGFDASLTGGQTNAQGLWWAEAGTTAGTGSITNITGGLSFSAVPGYSGNLPASFGNSINAVNINAHSPRMTINSPSGGTAAGNPPNKTNIFASFLLKVTGTNGMGTSATFFAGFNNTIGTQTAQPSVVGSKLFAALSGTGFKLGVGKSTAAAANIGFESATHATNEVIFVVLQYTFGATTADGTNYPSKLWVNPSPSTFGASTPPTPSASSVGTVDQDITDAKTFIFFQRATTQPSYIADELRISYTWAGVTAAPDFTSQPASRTNNAGTAATFTASALGDGPLSYQWQKNGSDISGATASSLTLNNVLTVDAGSYTVTVTNKFGTNVSPTALLTVNDPAITTQPASQSQPPGATVNFSVVAAGTPALTYQWQKNGSPLSDGGIISGASTANLTLTGVDLPDAGTYTCAVTNGSGVGLISANAVLTIIDPAITLQPTNITANFSSNVTFNVTAAGTPALTYQWYKGTSALTDGGNISGSTTPALTVSAVSYLDAGGYSVVVTNGPGNTVTSSIATLTVKDPVIFAHPASAIKAIGSSASFTVSAGASGATYSWKKGSTVLTDGGNVSGSTTATLTLANVSASDNGSYSVIVGSAGGSNVTSSSATLSTISAIAPAVRVVNVGDKVSFIAAASGTAPFSYQWKFNGSPISGATSTTLTKTGLQTSDSGTYTVDVTNPGGTSSATPAVLTVSPTRLTISPTNLVVLRQGEGSEPQQNNGNTLYLDQYTTNGAYVSSIMLPNSGPNSLLQSGSASTEGSITLSADQRFLMVVGYNVPFGFTNASLPAASSTAVPRGFATVNGLGYYNLPISANIYSGLGNRCAVTDGTNNFWTSAGGANIRYFGPAGTNITVSGTANTRVVQIANGNVVYSTAATPTYGIHELAGLASSLGTDTNIITTGNTSSFPADFAISPDGTTVYIAEDAGAGAGNTNFPGIQKWTYVPGNSNGVYQYTISLGSGSTTNGTRQLAVDFAAAPPIIYAVTCNSSNTTAGLNNSIVKVEDNGPSSVPTTFVSAAGANQGFRGIRFGPVADAPEFLTQPASRTNATGTNATFSPTVIGSDPRTYQWYKGVTPLSNGGNVSGANSATLVLANVSAADQDSYSLRVTNDLGFAISSAASLTVYDFPSIISGPQNATVNAGDSTNFTVSATGGGTLTYQWRRNGANLSDGGNISGASSTSLNLSNITSTDAASYDVVVANPVGSTTSTVATLTVLCPGITLTPATLPDATANSAYTQGLSGNGGSSPYSFSVASGALPSGLNLSGSGVLSGTPTTVGSYNFTVAATDSHVCTGSQAYTLDVIAPSAQPAVLSAATLPDNNIRLTVTGTANANYNVQGSTNLFEWESLNTNSSPFTYDDLTATNYPSRFYRAVWVP